MNSESDREASAGSRTAARAIRWPVNSESDREASAGLRTAARAIRDLYDGLTAEGFTERQAVAILGQMLAAARKTEDDG